MTVKSRTQLFGVKLPFRIKLIHSAWFENYTAAERALHEKLKGKRLSGEWFDLSEADIAFIRTQGQAQTIPAND